ncbi:hypothetical protein [Dactylosporangium sp. CA-092794]|uniref:hypothetical protein n=1 Tax=Dactylosporangium sp. CA-092794 TaxID=3239929 RepID=UPI003D8C53A1
MRHRSFLLREYLPAVYGDRAKLAERHLGHLARHLAMTGGTHLRWWELAGSLNAANRRALGFLFGTICVVLTFLLELPLGPTDAVFDGLTIGIAAGFLAATTIGRDSVLGRRLSPLPVRIGGWRRTDTLQLAADRYDGRGARRFAVRVGVRVGLISGIVWAIPVGFNRWALWNIPNVALATGVPVALAAWFATWLSQRIKAPVGLGRSIGPHAMLRLDRAAAWTEAALYGSAAAILGSILYPAISLGLLTLGPMNAADLRVADLIEVATVSAIDSAIIVLLTLPFLLTAWGRFLLVRGYLAWSRRLPWRLMRFLAEAHRKGVLRQAGAVYQFRHVAIQEHLHRRWSAPGNHGDAGRAGGA